MLALSPPLFSTTYGWPLEDLIAQNLQQGSSIEANYPLPDFPTNDQIQHDIAPENSISLSSGGIVNGNTGDHMKVSKRLNHNASERDRRRRVNSLYAFLRSLLPISSDQKKKASIPGIVSHALNYIPKLQKEVEALRIKKEKLLLCSSSISIMGKEHLDFRNQTAEESAAQRITSIVSASVSVLDNKEAVIQLTFSFEHINKNKNIGLLSKAIEYLEEEQGGGLVLLNATTFKCLGEKGFFNTLHFQMQGDYKIDAVKMKENLCSLYQESHNLLVGYLA